MRKYLSEGHARNETHDALADAQGEGAAGHDAGGTQFDPASPPLAETIAAMRYQHRLRNYHQEQRKRSDLSLGWFLKTQLGWSKTLPDAERKTIAQRAADLIEIGEAEFEAMQLGARTDLTKAEQRRYQKALRACETDEPAYSEWRRTIIATVASRKPHDDIEQETTEEMERLAEAAALLEMGRGHTRAWGSESRNHNWRDRRHCELSDRCQTLEANVLGRYRRSPSGQPSGWWLERRYQGALDQARLCQGSPLAHVEHRRQADQAQSGWSVPIMLPRAQKISDRARQGARANGSAVGKDSKKRQRELHL